MWAEDLHRYARNRCQDCRMYDEAMKRLDEWESEARKQGSSNSLALCDSMSVYCRVGSRFLMA